MSKRFKNCSVLLWSGVFIFLGFFKVACSQQQIEQQAAALRIQSSRVYRLLRFSDVVQPEQREVLARNGINLLARQGNGWWLAAGPETEFEQILDHCNVVDIQRQDNTSKYSAALREVLEGGLTGNIAVWAFGAQDQNADNLLNALREFDSNARSWGRFPLFELMADKNQIERLVEFEAIRYLDLQPGPAVPLLDQARAAINVDVLHNIVVQDPPVYDLAGNGTVGAIWDPEGVDPDCSDVGPALVRYPDPADASSLFHGTEVGGCLAGRGIASNGSTDYPSPMTNPWTKYHLRGMAPEAMLAMYFTYGDKDSQGNPTDFDTQYVEARDTYNANVVSFSFKADAGYGQYAGITQYIDWLIQGDPSLPDPIPMVVASANEGLNFGYDSVTNLACGKNTITAGGSDWADGSLWDKSSFGPTDDGRLKPEVMSPGCSTHGSSKVGIDKIRILGDGQPTIEWTFDSDAEGWTVIQDLTVPVINNGVMEMTTTGQDSGLLSPDGLNINTALYKRVEFTMSIERHHQAWIYWKNEFGGFEWPRFRRFLVNGDGEQNTIELDFTGIAGWTGTVEQIRLDPIDPGTLIPAPWDNYVITCGTSFAAPSIAGGILLILEKWRTVFPSEPDPMPALFKGLLVATADDMIGSGPGANPDLGGNPTPYYEGPDYPTGYGQVDIAAAVGLVEAAGQGKHAFVTGNISGTGDQLDVRFVLAPAPEKPFSLTLVWTDPYGPIGSAPVLQNDLDLIVTGAKGVVFSPWVLDASSPDKPATTGVDRLNNLEQVFIRSPKPGAYQFSVKGYELVSEQDFAVVFSDPSVVKAVIVDSDRDGHFGDDCDNKDPKVHPGAKEIRGNGKDDDCDPATSDELLRLLKAVWLEKEGKNTAENGGDIPTFDADAEMGFGCSLSESSTGTESILLLFALFVLGFWRSKR
ncbi:MAG: S8 family serine peptidase [Pseudomonadota bacterium]